MAQKIKKPQRGVSREFFRSSDRNLAKIQAAITELDACVTGYEKRYGIDRLPELVSIETQVKYWSQVDKLDAAIDSDDADMVIKYASGMQRAFKAMESEARERGHDELKGEWFECATKDGRVVIVASSFAESHKAARERPDALVYAIDEIAALLGSESVTNVANKVKELFPVATVVDVNSTKVNLNDEIPF
jgi:hypothetical protein